ncbi:MAG: DUF2061 domain-containing protein [Candidatus Levybacteria bacterium]|nr:DUF2061 domain-containing protein [Candidatus Levybacteria bacterium]
MRIKEQKKRSVVKTITYRILIIIATAIVTFGMTKRWDLTIGITSVTTVVNTLLYYFHERVWNSISWGKK